MPNFRTKIDFFGLLSFDNHNHLLTKRWAESRDGREDGGGCHQKHTGTNQHLQLCVYKVKEQKIMRAAST
jgi:hypothetical protein